MVMTYVIDFLIFGTTTPEEITKINDLLQQLKKGIAYMPQDRLEEVLGEGSVVVVARNSEGKIIGMATLIFYSKLAKGLVGVIEDVVVDAAYHRQGIGTKLMERLLSTAKQNKLGSVRLTSDNSRQAAHKVYEKLGFKKVDTNFFGIVFDYSCTTS